MTPARQFGSLSKARGSQIADLSTRAGRERHGLFLLEGPRAIEDALGRGARLSYLVADPTGEEAVARWLAAGLVPESTALYRAETVDVERLADTTTPQGILAVGELPLEGLAALAEPGSVILLVDGIQDPGNLGTLLRTLAAVGGKAAICCKGTVDPFNPKALRGSAGAALSLAVARGVEREAAAGWCAERGVAIIALAAGGSDLFAGRQPAGPLALAVGGEAAGLSPEIERAAALVVGIPMEPTVESLSAAVAGSVALYALAHDLVRGDG
ncbi:MAG TPA: RNA methyltransferase [Gemmatimonadota bacterium]|nr:RNA methyltransferase [Gemmatimonadota bacterium]